MASLTKVKTVSCKVLGWPSRTKKILMGDYAFNKVKMWVGSVVGRSVRKHHISCDQHFVLCDMSYLWIKILTTYYLLKRDGMTWVHVLRKSSRLGFFLSNIAAVEVVDATSISTFSYYLTLGLHQRYNGRKALYFSK